MPAVARRRRERPVETVREPVEVTLERLQREVDETRALLHAIVHRWIEQGDERAVGELLELAGQHLIHQADACLQCGHERAAHVGGAGRCWNGNCPCRKLVAVGVR